MLLGADTSPLIVLAKLNRLDLLRAEYAQVVIPPGVYREGVIIGQQLHADDAGAIQRAIADGLIEVRAPQQPISMVTPHLGSGEIECIQLALEAEAAAVLMDDFNARRAARETFAREGRTIAVRGTLGIIAGAVQAGRLDAQDAIALVTNLRDRDDVWINPALCDLVIAALRQ
jgi:uncharacterized protein